MKFRYQEIKDISILMNKFKEEYWELKLKYKNDYTLDAHLSLNILDEIIYRLKEISNIESKYVNFIELKSDIDFIEEYYKLKKFTSVVRWLSNTESTLKETFSDYIEQVKISNNYKKKTNEN